MLAFGLWNTTNNKKALQPLKQKLSMVIFKILLKATCSRCTSINKTMLWHVGKVSKKKCEENTVMGTYHYYILSKDKEKEENVASKKLPQV